MSFQGMLTVTTVVVGILAVCVAYYSNVSNRERLTNLQFKLSFVERQLSELYGPLHGLFILSQTAYAETLRLMVDDGEIREKLGVNLSNISDSFYNRHQAIENLRRSTAYLDPYDFFKSNDRFEQKAIWLEMCKAEILNRNDKISELISSNWHLISPNTDHAPPSIEQLLHHLSEFKTRNNIYKARGNAPQLFAKGTPWPKDIDRQIELKLELLNALQNKYRTQIEVSRSIRFLFRVYCKKKIDKLDLSQCEKLIKNIESLSHRSELQTLNLIHARTRLRKEKMLRFYRERINYEKIERIAIRKNGAIVAGSENYHEDQMDADTHKSQATSDNHNGASKNSH